MNKPLSLMALVLLASCSSKLFQIQKRFQEKYTQFSKLTLPKMAEEKSLQEELRLFTEMHQLKQFQQFKPDPELSSQFLLKKENSWSQSLYFVGKEVSNLLLEVTVTHDNNVHQFDNQSIEVYVINCESNQIIFGDKVKHLRRFKAEVVSQLYELRTVFNWKINSQSSEEEPGKHVRLSLSIVPIAKVIVNDSKTDEIKSLDKLLLIKNETDRIFINSLQIWQEVQKHHQEHFANQQKVYFQSYLQLIGIILINLVELLLMRRTLKVQSII